MDAAPSLIILSLFCAGGLFVYLRESFRLGRRIKEGHITRATVRKKRKIDSGSESMVHYLVTWELLGPEGKSMTHAEDMNSAKFFDGVSEGDEIPILDATHPRPTSYALSQIRCDLLIDRAVCIALVLAWIAMGFSFDVR